MRAESVDWEHVAEVQQLMFQLLRNQGLGDEIDAALVQVGSDLGYEIILGPEIPVSQMN